MTSSTMADTAVRHMFSSTARSAAGSLGSTGWRLLGRGEAGGYEVEMDESG